MKKTMFMTIVASCAMLVACNKPAQTEGTESAAQTEEKEVTTAQKSEAVAGLRVAYDLAKYGYEVESATALIEAANIMVGIPQSVLEDSVQQGEKTEDETVKGTEKSLTPEALIAAAKEFAGDDETMLAMAAKVEAKIAAEAEAVRSGARGAVGGPKYGTGTVYAHSYMYYDVQFYGNSFAECVVIGDGDTDLDVYVYDENGHLIDSDTDYTDDCYVSWVPSWTGYFRIKIVNRGGVYNNFTIITN